MKVKRIHLLPGEVLVISAPGSSIDDINTLKDILGPHVNNRVVLTNATMNFMVLSSEPPEGDDGEEAEVEPAEAEAKVFKKKEPEVILA